MIDIAHETIAVDLQLSFSPVRIVCTYLTNAGSSSERKFLVLGLCALLETLCVCSFPVILVGDFNLPEIDWLNLTRTDADSKESLFVNFCVDHGFSQLVGEPTRTVSGSLLDLLLTNLDGLVDVPVQGFILHHRRRVW